MRIVSFVPSLTETLIEAGVNVVGRTRYCIHPAPQVAQIPIVGGTKDWRPEEIKKLRPDLLILDKEENPKFMAENPEFRFHATHAASLRDMPALLRELGAVLNNETLGALAAQFEGEIARAPKISTIPAVLEWNHASQNFRFDQVVYLIWRNPWMAVGPGTFIASVLEHLGLKMAPLVAKYPEVKISQFDPERTLFLFSSEPYPFLKIREEIAALGVHYAIVDGEKYSWFGTRVLRFLQAL